MAIAATVTQTPATEQTRKLGTRSPAPLRPPAPLKASQFPTIRLAASLRDSLSPDNGSDRGLFVGRRMPAGAAGVSRRCRPSRLGRNAILRVRLPPLPLGAGAAWDNGAWNEVRHKRT